MLNAVQTLPNTLSPLILTMITRDCIYDSYFLFSFFCLHHVACRSKFPSQGSKLCPLWWKCRVSTTGPRAKSHDSHFPYKAREAETLGKLVEGHPGNYRKEQGGLTPTHCKTENAPCSSLPILKTEGAPLNPCKLYMMGCADGASYPGGCLPWYFCLSLNPSPLMWT